MSNRRAPLTQAELTRYLKAYRDAGIPVARTEIGRDGTVVIFTGSATTETAENTWDSE